MFFLVVHSLASTGITAGRRSAPGIQIGNHHTPLTALALENLHQAHAGQPSLETIGCGHHVAVRFGIVRYRFDAEHGAHLVHDATLLPVHHRERVAARVFALLGQFHQFGELLVDHLDQSGILLGKGLEEVRIVGLQLGRQVRVADLESDGEPTVTF